MDDDSEEFAVPTYTLENFEGLVEQTRHVNDLWARRGISPSGFYFRGVGSSAYLCTPKLLRKPYAADPHESMAVLECQLMLDVVTRSRQYAPGSVLDSYWERMFFMQHHGFPTRLLDWTESMACAAYFATRAIGSDEDCAIWLMAPSFLVAMSGRHGRHHDMNDERLDPYVVVLHRSGDVALSQEFQDLPPVPVYPPHSSARAVAQRSRFTIHNYDPIGLHRIAASDFQEHGDSCFLQKFVIPGNCRIEVRKQAGVFGGATEATLFPDIEGLARGWCFQREERARTAKERP